MQATATGVLAGVSTAQLTDGVGAHVHVRVAAAVIREFVMQPSRTSYDSKLNVDVVIYDFDDNESLLALDSLLLCEGPVNTFVFDESTVPSYANRQRLDQFASKHGGDSVKKILPNLPRGRVKRREYVLGTICRVMGMHFDERLVEDDVALSAVGAALQGAEETGAPMDEACVQYSIVRGRLGSHMRLDVAAAQALNLFPVCNARCSSFGLKHLSQSHRGAATVFEVLNQCKTRMGPVKLEQWLRRPLVDKGQIEARLDVVQYLVENSELRDTLRELLGSGVPDLTVLVTKLWTQTATLIDLHRLHQFTVKLFPKISIAVRDGFSSHEYLNNRFVAPLIKAAIDMELFNNMIEATLDLDFLPEVLLNASVDEELVELRNEMNLAKQEVISAHEIAAGAFAQAVLHKCLQGDDPSKWPLKLEKDNYHGFVLRSPKPFDEKTIAKAKWNHDSDAHNQCFEVIGYLKNGVYITTPALKRAASLFQCTRNTYHNAQDVLKKELVKTASTYASVVDVSCAALAEIDVFASLAHVAVFAQGGPFVRPTFVDSAQSIDAAAFISIKQARHPCVETAVDSFVANDYELGSLQEEFTDATTQCKRLAIVTGPNMGGKSTYIRGLGSLVVMAQAGSFVPAKKAVLSVFDSVLARVGAGDSIQRGVSTFMAEMLEASTILNLASPQSLVIIDELGRGTSTFDGFGLAWAISQHLATKNKALCLFATHYHELTALGCVDDESANCGHHTKLTSVATNLHVSARATTENITFLYNVAKGPCARSFGLHVAHLAGFPKDTLAIAQSKIDQLERRSASKRRFAVISK
mmetsp:Transcript_3817/g.15118  ORF Transcript_3817/g.15118 Transcript_3817/m.15118 type:complete len:812 (-) Transcript_3817:441-2876(-)|eukprot:CAMPEP_0185692896 /NCGR_PEP_ID=MMETSP1164-20130828/2859_1 /TAXON_ID=1104430 /ORGANISM="Chrysoreinhardia sp, Strain CCMP2950" /LENGTH=811 /DNA_ID=CAMNT_0028359653 /DNA_START=167 /DNA_END=2602 /DNA_ORIENTATION=+